MSPTRARQFVRSAALFSAGGTVCAGYHDLTEHGHLSESLVVVAAVLIPVLCVAWMLLHVLADLRDEVRQLRTQREQEVQRIAAAAVMATLETGREDATVVNLR